MNNNKETKNDQVVTIENKTQTQKHSLTHSEMMQSLHSKFFKNNPNSFNPLSYVENNGIDPVSILSTTSGSLSRLISGYGDYKTF